MRKVIVLIFIICFFISGCNSQKSNPEPQPKTVSDFVSNISLGITPEQLLKDLSNLDIAINIPDYNEYPLPDDALNAIADGRIYNMTDLSFYYKIKYYDLYFCFSYEGYLETVSCTDKNIATSKGIIVGNTIDTVKKLYGNDYKENIEDISVLQYKTDKGYLNIFYQENLVTNWNLSKYPNTNND